MLRLRLFLLLCLLALVGCSGQSVRHLPTSQWKSTTPQTLQMRYLSFQYQVVPMGEEVGVVAEAYPVINRLPDWASWYGEVTLSIYITDGNGRVLATNEQALLPRPLERESGLPIEARFDLGTDGRQPIYVTFGYSLALTDAAPGKSTRRMVVAEGALRH